MNRPRQVVTTALCAMSASFVAKLIVVGGGTSCGGQRLMKLRR